MPATICEHDDAMLTRAALSLLSETEQAELGERLAACDTCRERFAQYQALVAGLQRLVPAQEAALAPMSEERDSPRAPAYVRERWQARRAGGGELTPDHYLAPLPTLRKRRAVTLVGTLAAILLLALFAGTFWSFGPGRGQSGAPSQPASLRPLPHVEPILGTVPIACAGAPAPQSNVDGVAGAIGGAPFWIGGFVGTHATLLAGGTTPSRFGWYGKIVTHVDASMNGTVTVRGTNLRDGTPVWFQLDGAATTGPTFRQSAGTSDAGYIFIPTAGCYTLTVNWATGSWTYTFAAGSALPTSVATTPTSCLNQPIPAPLAANLPTVIGQLPLWVTANSPRASFHLDLSGDGVPVTFFVSNSFVQTVSIRGRNTNGDAPVGFVAPPNPPATVLTLNNSYVRSAGPYTEWQGRAYFPAAGCYALTATWPGGSWTFDVAAGG